MLKKKNEEKRKKEMRKVEVLGVWIERACEWIRYSDMMAPIRQGGHDDWLKFFLLQNLF